MTEQIIVQGELISRYREYSVLSPLKCTCTNDEFHRNRETHLQQIVFITSVDTRRTMFIIRGQIGKTLNITYKLRIC